LFQREEIGDADPNVAAPKTSTTFSPKSAMRRRRRAMNFEAEQARLARRRAKKS